MNPVVKAQLEDFKKNYPHEFSNDSDYFELMSIFAVENGILGEDVNPLKIHLKGNEFGVDGVGIIIQGSLCTDIDEADDILNSGSQHTKSFHFFQSKSSSKLDYGDLSKFLDGVYDFFTDNKLLTSVQISDLLTIKDKLYSTSSKRNPDICCYYCTTGSGQVSKEIENIISCNQKKLDELNIFENIVIKCLGARDIQNGYRSATNSIKAKINFPKVVTMPPHDDVDEAYIGYIQADQILEIAMNKVNNDGEKIINRSVFYDNVRDFNPNSEINQSIINELKNGDCSSFVFKNNGITVVAKSVSRKGDVFSIEDYQIVNGCQTTNILSSLKEKASSIFVPFRLIGSNNPEFVSSIIMGTNKQNEVKEDQFLALLPFMKNLEEYCASQEAEGKIFIERRENQYKDVPVEKARIMKPSDLLKVVAAMFFFQPHRAARDYRGIRKEFSQKIFLENHNVELYHLAALALYKFEYLVRNSRIDRSRTIYKFYILYALIRREWKFNNILDASPKSQRNIKNTVMDIVNDTNKFIAHAESIANEMDEIINNSQAKTREQIRDYIRSENTLKIFDSKVFSAD